MGGIRGGVDAVDITNIGGIVVSGKVPTTAAGGGSNVNVTNVSGNVRAVIQGVDTAGSALNVNAVLNATEVAVTAGATPLPVNVVQTSAQIHVTAGGASLPVTIQGIESGSSALRVILNQGSETKVTGAASPLPVSAAGVAVSGNKQAVDLPGVAIVSGAIKTTAVGAGGAAVAITNVSGQVPVTAGNSPLPVIASISGDVRVTVAGNFPVSGHMRAQVETSAPADVNELAYGVVRMTSARGLHVAQQGAVLVGICGVNVASSALQVDIKTPGTNIGISAATLANVSVGGVYLSGIDTATSGTRALTSGVFANTSAIRSDTGVVRSLVTASALNVNATFGAAEVAVTAGGSPLPVLASISGQVAVTAGNSPLPVSLSNVSGQVQVTSPGGPLTDVCGVNRTGSALNVFLAGTSAEVHITAGGANVPVTIAAQPIAVSIAAKNAIDVSAQGAALQVTAQGGSFAVSAQGAALTVSSNNPGAVMGAIRGDAVFNALVSNPVKFARFQAAGAVCADVVAAVAGRKIRVLGGFMMSTGTATAIWMTTGASAALTGKLPLVAGMVMPVGEFGYFETAAGSALSLQIESGTIGGAITYTEVF